MSGKERMGLEGIGKRGEHGEGRAGRLKLRIVMSGGVRFTEVALYVDPPADLWQTPYVLMMVERGN